MHNEKQELEISALNQFSEALAALLGEERFVFHELRDPPQPDGYCSFDGQPLHVEVGHIYGTRSDAKRLLGRTGKSAAMPAEMMNARMVPLNARLLRPLNDLLDNKETKTYQGSRVWLLIRSAFPLWTINDFTEYQTEIRIPQSHRFEQIWLLCGPRVDFGVLRLA
jgi:hypothetical protein